MQKPIGFLQNKRKSPFDKPFNKKSYKIDPYTKAGVFLFILSLLLILFFFWQINPVRGDQPVQLLQMPDMSDVRLSYLHDFLVKYSCSEDYNQTFLDVSDANSLDYRLLPSLWVIESTCGKHELYNNGFGIGGAGHLKHYQSTQDAISDTAAVIVKLQSKFGVLDNVFSHYCPTKGYPESVERLINQMPE